MVYTAYCSTASITHFDADAVALFCFKHAVLELKLTQHFCHILLLHILHYSIRNSERAAFMNIVKSPTTNMRYNGPEIQPIEIPAAYKTQADNISDKNSSSSSDNTRSNSGTKRSREDINDSDNLNDVELLYSLCPSDQGL
jgi:hypothetical protein